ncbi:hypothetical protein PybrP1_001266 [[Pythium] brassicae (nom. inval.)]|nr:hypothetical protein PybrP1_001266 [[Pythium] brassicae (nom. inval.)]
MRFLSQRDCRRRLPAAPESMRLPAQSSEEGSPSDDTSRSRHASRDHAHGRCSHGTRVLQLLDEHNGNEQLINTEGCNASGLLGVPSHKNRSAWETWRSTCAVGKVLMLLAEH